MAYFFKSRIYTTFRDSNFESTIVEHSGLNVKLNQTIETNLSREDNLPIILHNSNIYLKLIQVFYLTSPS